MRTAAHPAGLPASSRSRPARLAAVLLTAAGLGVVAAAPATAFAGPRAPGGWVIQPTPDAAGVTRILFAVSCPAVRACTAVGEQQTAAGVRRPLAERWNGVRWAVLPARGGNAAFNGVSCPAARECIAVGGGTAVLAERWNGSRWAVQPTPTPADAASAGRQMALDAVACPRRTFCLAVGGYLDVHRDQRQLALSWNGRSWRIVRGMPLPGPGSLQAISCSGPRACTAVGNYFTLTASSLGFAERWDGRGWSLQRLPRLHGRNVIVSGVSCPAARMCVAAGTAETPSSGIELAERWDGSTWTAERLPAPAGQARAGGGVTGVSCTSARLCVAVGGFIARHSRVRVLAEQWAGNRWVIQRPQDATSGDSNLYSVSCPRRGRCTAVGDALTGSRSRALVERQD
jgi:hypothetical protein